MGQCCSCESKTELRVARQIVLPSLELFLSVRFNMIDAYVRPPLHSAPFPPACHYVLQYRRKATQHAAWNSVPPTNLKRPDTCPGRFCTIPNLYPFSEYEVHAKLVSEADNSIVAESSLKTATTSKRIAIVKSYITIHDFSKRVEHELSTIRGDVLQENPELSHFFYESNVLSKNGSQDFGCFQNIRTNKVGLVPLVCVTRRPDLDRPSCLKDQECFYNVNRRKAEVWMMRPNVETGRFIVRPSHSSTFMALSVRFGLSSDGVPQVEHFMIFSLSDGFGCYVNVPTRTFEDINALISYYKNNSLSPYHKITLSAPFPRHPQPPKDVTEVNIFAGNIIFGEKLGNGHFGEVFKARLNRLDVAVKKLLPTQSLTQSEEFLQEAKEMAAFFHENLVRLIGVCTDAQPYLIVSEYMNRGSLLKWLNNDTYVVDIQQQDVLFILSQVAAGMVYLGEEKHVVHRDLRAANVLVHDENDQLEIKITDFGLTRKIRENEEIYQSNPFTLVPVRWTAPEACGKSSFSVKSDVWSFGVLSYEVFTLGTMPYKGKTNDEVSAFVQNGGRLTLQECRNNKRKVALQRSRPVEEICPDTLFNEIERCWNLDPHNRPTFEALYDILENYETASAYN